MSERFHCIRLARQTSNNKTTANAVVLFVHMHTRIERIIIEHAHDVCICVVCDLVESERKVVSARSE